MRGSGGSFFLALAVIVLGVALIWLGITLHQMEGLK
jgi:hypothetical protein